MKILKKSKEEAIYLVEMSHDEIPGKSRKFAVTMNDDSMEPLYKAGDCLIIDRDVERKNGDCVLVEVEPDEHDIPGPYVYIRQCEETDDFVTLKPLNSKYPELKFWAHRGPKLHNILGRVVDRVSDTSIIQEVL